MRGKEKDVDKQFRPFIIDFKFNKLLVLEDTDLIHPDIPEIGPGYYYVIIMKKHGEIFFPKYIKKKYINFISSKYKQEYNREKIEQIYKQYIDFLLADFL